MAIERFLCRSERPLTMRNPPACPTRWTRSESVAENAGGALDLNDHSGPIPREEFRDRYGATPGEVRRVEAFAQEFDLTVVRADLATRQVVLSGTIAAMNEAFGTSLKLYQCAHAGWFAPATGPLYLPADLADLVVGVFGLDNRPQAQVRCRRHRPIVSARSRGATPHAAPDRQALSLSDKRQGAGQTVAIIELGGGYKAADLNTYFAALGIKTPSVTAVSVDGGKNAPSGDPNSADGEVLLDIEIVGAIASGARIAVYFAPNTDKGFLDAITTAVHDAVRKPAIVSIS